MDVVIQELKILLSRGVKFLFVAEPEFNTHLRHANEFCDRVLEEGLKFEWSCYLNPVPLTGDLVRKMKLAGCVKPCISVDSGDDNVLSAFETSFRVEHVRRMADWFHANDFPFTVDMMFGGPGETLDSARMTIDLMEEIRPAIVGMNLGVRIYANTGFGRKFLAKKFPIDGTVYGKTEGNDDLFWPIFYISDMAIGDYLKEVCQGDEKYRLLGYSGFGGINLTAKTA